MDPLGHPEQRTCTSEELRVRLQEALAIEPELAGRLSKARTSVAFVVVDDEGGGAITLLLDRRPPVVAPRSEPAEVEMHLSAAQAHSFSCGELALPAAVLNGDVRCYGPARAYLGVDAVLRTLLARSL